MRIEPLGDRALLVELGGAIDRPTLRRVRAVVAQLDAAAIAGVTDLVAGYTSVAVHYDPVRVLAAGAVRSATSASTVIRGAVEAVLRADASVDAALPAPRSIEIPVRYGGADGPDLEEVARTHGMSAEEVVARHTAATYTVHLVGFVPGFPYLGGLDPRLATPRRATPRALVPRGSVGIGGEQTGVYPFDSPGGWQLIGRTPLVLFDPSRREPALLRVGDEVRFRAVDAAEYRRLEAR